MPREQIRKRGKRKTKQQQEDSYPAPITAPTQQQEDASNDAGPSTIHPARAAMLKGRTAPSRPEVAPHMKDEDTEQPLEWSRGPRSGTDPDFPFGILDPDLKAYFRNVDEQIRDWEGVSSIGEEREDRQMFLDNVLSELRGNELVVATDPDTAVILERLMPSLGDWGRRVIGDAFGDKWEMLLRHRFGSHVAQTWFTLAADTLDREAREIWPPQHKAQTSKPKAADTGYLPTMTELLTTILASLEPSLPTLITDSHSSPPIRLLLLLLAPSRQLPKGDERKGDIVRSKKSGKYRKGQSIQGKSIFGSNGAEDQPESSSSTRKIPDFLVKSMKEMTKKLIREVSAVEWRSMGVNEVASATVQLLVDLEIEDCQAEEKDSLLDYLTEGLISQLAQKKVPTPQPYLTSSLSFAVGTRLFETLLRVSPSKVFEQMWSLYFKGKIGRFAVHPYANFVVAQGVSRLDHDGVMQVIKECNLVGGGKSLIKMGRTSVLQALVNRSLEIHDCQSKVNDLIISALDIPKDETISLVPCLMALRSYPAYKAIISGEEPPAEAETEELAAEVRDETAEEAAAAAARLEGWKTRRVPKPAKSELTPNMQGSLLLQAMVKMEKANEVVLESFLSLDIPTLLKYASHPVSSRLFDAILQSDNVSSKFKRRLLTKFLGHYRTLAEIKIGSTVADKMWFAADGFMKEKIARSLIPEATALANSQWGRFLAAKVDVQLLQRRPAEWRAAQTGFSRGPNGTSNNKMESRVLSRPHADNPVEATEIANTTLNEHQAVEEKSEKHKKRKQDGAKDEIDDLFAGVKEKKKKKSRD